jgi:hypothetical protein
VNFVVEVNKKDERESNEALMKRFQRQALIIFREVKGRGEFKKKPNRKTRRQNAVRREKVRKDYDLGVKTGAIKVEPFGKKGGRKSRHSKS